MADEIPIGVTKPQRTGISEKFREFSYSDCRHDFHTTNVSDLLENTPLNTSLNSFERARRIAAIRATNKENVYNQLETFLPSILGASATKASAAKQKWTNEAILLESITEIKDVILKSILKTAFGLGADDTTTEAQFNSLTTAYNKSVTVTLGAENKRNYTLKAFPYKLREPEGDESFEKPPALVFETVSGSKKNAFVVDASFLPLSRLQENTEDDGQYDFIFLQSIENQADSATKIGSFVAGSSNINIRIAIDEGATGIFPDITSENQTANLFTTVGFQTQRDSTGTQVNGKFKISDTQNLVLNDLGEISNITNAAQLAINKYVEYNNRAAGPTPEQQKEIVTHLLTKRAGDWCQALCLLDKSRIYKIRKLDNSEGNEEKSLADIEKTHKLGVVTHDRILLAYCLLIGVNCFFTMKLSPGNAALLFFENNLSSVGTQEDIDKAKMFDKATLQTDLKRNQTSLGSEKNALKNAIEELKLEGGNLGVFLKSLYLNIYKYNSFIDISSLDNELTGIQEPVNFTTANVKEYLSIYDSITNKVTSIIAKNNAIRSLTNPASVTTAINGLIELVKSGKTLKQSTAFINFTESYIYPLKDMLKLIGPLSLQPVTVDTISASIPTEGLRRVANITDNAKYINIFLNELFVRQAGGVAKNEGNYAQQLNEQFFKLRHRSIVALRKFKPVNFRGQVSLEGGEGNSTKFIGQIRNYITDRAGRYYSIIDDFIITEDDCDLFITSGSPCDNLREALFSENDNFSILSGRNDAKEMSADSFFEFMYMYLRFLLLHHDNLYTQFKKMENINKALFEEEIEKTYEYKNLKKNIETLRLYTKKLFGQRNLLLTRSKVAGTGVAKTPIQILEEDLSRIRTYIFNAYNTSSIFSTNESPTGIAYRTRLENYLLNEAAQILLTIREDERGYFTEYIQNEELSMKKEAVAALVNLYGRDSTIITVDTVSQYFSDIETTEGGFRTTRRRRPSKKHLRKTRGLKTRK